MTVTVLVLLLLLLVLMSVLELVLGLLGIQAVSARWVLPWAILASPGLVLARRSVPSDQLLPSPAAQKPA
jgi:hypothetical protein